MLNFCGRKLKMMCRSKKIVSRVDFSPPNRTYPHHFGGASILRSRATAKDESPTLPAKKIAAKRAFSLVEVLTALAILALISSSVLVVINRCVASAADSALRIQAFEVARENMEKLLASPSVKENVEYGQSNKYPEITWQTVVETFYEPITSRMWVRGVCSAEYRDTEGQEQKVELTHWLTGLTKEQLLEVMTREGEEGQLTAELIGTIDEAAKYAGVDVQTIERWLDNGMLTTKDGLFIRMNLDIYMRNGGNPSPDDKSLQVKSEAELTRLTGRGGKQGRPEARQDDIDPQTGLTYGELEGMDVSEVWKLLKNRQR
ncbi:MAG: prepilin-type N-terminal cleavage/methylation domain-containing protein [Sedimentisphaerales bacterium]